MMSLSESYNNTLQIKSNTEKMFNIMPRGRLGRSQLIREQTAQKVKAQEIRLLRMERDKNEHYEEQQYEVHLKKMYTNMISGDDDFSIHVTKILSVSRLTCKEKVKLIEETARIVEENEGCIRFRDMESIQSLPDIPGYICYNP
jgi:hypothetical protein